MKASHFYKNIKSAHLLTTCSQISEREWDDLYKGTVKANAKEVEKIIKTFLPELADHLMLNLRNPWRNQCSRKKGLLIYIHSATDYFIQID